MFESWGDMMCSEAEAENDRLAEEEAAIERQHEDFCLDADILLAKGEATDWLKCALYEAEESYHDTISEMVLHLLAGRTEQALAMKDAVRKAAKEAIVDALWREKENN